MKKTIYNKLVRDRIPEIINSPTKKANYRILDDSEFLRALNRKLDEEHSEYQNDLSIEELADMQEVINCIVESKGYSLEEFNEIRRAKAKRNGAFKNKIFLVDVIEED